MFVRPRSIPRPASEVGKDIELRGRSWIRFSTNSSKTPQRELRKDSCGVEIEVVWSDVPAGVDDARMMRRESRVYQAVLTPTFLFISTCLVPVFAQQDVELPSTQSS